MSPLEEIKALIPHREPFLWIDKILTFHDSEIITEKTFSPDLDLFNGHYPENPITPGVILCEAIFQSGAVLMAKIGQQADSTITKVPVLTRIKNAKFKRSIYPGDIAEISVQLLDTVSSASYLKGTLRIDGKVAVQVDFVCALVEEGA